MLVESLQAQDKELERRKEQHWKVPVNLLKHAFLFVFHLNCFVLAVRRTRPGTGIDDDNDESPSKPTQEALDQAMDEHDD